MNPLTKSLGPNYYGSFNNEGYFGFTKTSDYILLFKLSRWNAPNQPAPPAIAPLINIHPLPGFSFLFLSQ